MSLRALALLSGVYDLLLGLPMLLAAPQLARLFGARVIATAGSDAKRARASELGADEVIDHYVETGILRSVRGDRAIDQVTDELVRVVELGEKRG